MLKRININSAEPEALKAMMALETYLAQTSIPKTVKELISPSVESKILFIIRNLKRYITNIYKYF